VTGRSAGIIRGKPNAVIPAAANGWIPTRLGTPVIRASIVQQAETEPTPKILMEDRRR
jgi:hypothetical protein